ncbi:MAG: Wzz/FepE/Etk N-terminal domain-containing protein [Oscillospiraceae bacterium]|nr:Wzz/FepE/Etk N-terminal domain-containing protein [Oscillospiraceae bacterium]
MEQNLNQETGEIEIDLLELLKALWRHAWIIILAIVVGGGGAFSAAYFGITPTYEASAMLYVNNSMSSSISSTISSISSGDLTASKSLVDTYIVILGTRNVLEDVIEVSGVDYTYEELSKMIEAEAVNSTEIFEVTVTSTDPEEATLLANTIATVLPDKIDDIVNGSSAKIVDWAVIPAEKAAPSITRYTAVGMLVGLVLSCAVICVMSIMDDTIRTEDYLSTQYKTIPVLAVIPDLASTGRRGSRYGYYYRDSRTPAAKGGK